MRTAIQETGGSVVQDTGFAAKFKHAFVTVLWVRPWPVWVGALALGFLNILMFAYMRALGVFPQMAMWGAQLFNRVGIEVAAPFKPYPLTPLHLDVHSMIDFGIILGVFAAAFLAREFKIRKDDWKGCLTGFVGGVLMGYGTVITPPCNIGGFFSATMALSLSGPLMAVGLLFGAWIGGLFLQSQVRRAAQDIDFESAEDGEPAPSAGPSRQPWLAAVALSAVVIAAAVYTRNDMPKHAGLLLFGAMVGIVFQRSRLCFAAAFREILVSRNGTIMKAILLSIGLSTLAFAILKAGGHQPMHFVLPAGLHTVFGGFIFGIGMVIAGGCGSGILWRSAEGYVRSWFAFVGGILSAGSWVLVYGNKVGEGWLYGQPVFLPDKLGWVGGIGAVFVFLAGFYLFILWLESRREETQSD